MSNLRRNSTMMVLDLRMIRDTRWVNLVIGTLVVLSSFNLVACSHSERFSAPLNSSEYDDGFKPIIPSNYDPEYIARNLFTETGQYRIFTPIDSDLRITNYRLDNNPEVTALTTTTTKRPKSDVHFVPIVKTGIIKNISSEGDTDIRPMEISTTENQQASNGIFLAQDLNTPEGITTKGDTITKVDITTHGDITTQGDITAQENPSTRENTESSVVEADKDDFLDTALRSELKGLEDLLLSYLNELFVSKTVTKPGITVEINEKKEAIDSEDDQNDSNLSRSLKRLVRSAVVKVPLPRAVQTGRLFFISGLKKILWPIFIGIQVVKSILFALFLPSIIGSLGKIASQGSISSAGFNRPSETVSDLNFKDNFEDDSKFTMMNGGYAYNQPEASTNHFTTQLLDAAAINNNALSRFGMTDQRDNYMNSLGYDGYKNTNTNLETSPGYDVFKKLPSSSLLLSNYDPFYSPLLSRLDSVFQQLGLKSNDENCREKIICSMYANPSKYAPYSNLVSAQLSRELDELRKPTVDNPEILRFFKYMKAAKDGQDGIQCEDTYSMCTEFKDFDNPAMINAFHDINKLVEARKFI